VGVSDNVIEASWLALLDAIKLELMTAHRTGPGPRTRAGILRLGRVASKLVSCDQSALSERVLLCLTTCAAADDSLSSLTKAVTAFKLQNGAQFFVVERPYSPFVSFHLRARAGVADEPSGRGGLPGSCL
jgi:hypothetical protein